MVRIHLAQPETWSVACWSGNYTTSLKPTSQDRIIILKSDCTMAPVDALVVGEILSVEDVFQRLISYDEEQCLETFLCGLCTIYFSEHPVRENTTDTVYIGH
ncbi:hypothetical protein ACQJBY_033960 [Aegilops geniculata]